MSAIIEDDILLFLARATPGDHKERYGHLGHTVFCDAVFAAAQN